MKEAAKKGLYIVTPERKGAGPARYGKYMESHISFQARKHMQIHYAQSAPEEWD